MRNINLPEGWKFKTIGECFKITKGKKVEPIEYRNNAIRYIQIDDLRNDTNIKYCLNDNKYVVANKEDIIIAWDGANAGTIGYGLTGAIGSTLAVLNSVVSEIDTKYVGIYLKSKFKYLRDRCTGATIPHIQRKVLEDLIIPIPPLETQKKIVEVLEKAEEALEKRKEANRLLDEYLKSVFVEMFGDPTKNEKGWNQINLKDVVDRIESGWSPKAQNEPAIDGWGVLKLSAVTGGSYNQYQNKAFLEGVEPKEDLEVKEGDLLFTRKNTRELVGDSAYVFETRTNLMLPDTIFRFVTKDNINKIFLWALFNNKGFRPQITALANGSAGSMPNISKAKLMDLEIICPDINEQDKFAKIVYKIQDIKNQYNKSMLDMEALFNSLMKEVFIC